MIAEPDNELKLRNRVNKPVLHIHYIENEVQSVIKNQQDNQKYRLKPFSFLTNLPDTFLYYVGMRKYNNFTMFQ